MEKLNLNYIYFQLQKNCSAYYEFIRTKMSSLLQQFNEKNCLAYYSYIIKNCLAYYGIFSAQMILEWCPQFPNQLQLNITYASGDGAGCSGKYRSARLMEINIFYQILRKLFKDEETVACHLLFCDWDNSTKLNPKAKESNNINIVFFV